MVLAQHGTARHGTQVIDADGDSGVVIEIDEHDLEKPYHVSLRSMPTEFIDRSMPNHGAVDRWNARTLCDLHQVRYTDDSEYWQPEGQLGLKPAVMQRSDL